MQTDKKLRIVSGIIYDDEYALMHGGNRFYYLNGDIETDINGRDVYIESRRKENGKESEDDTFLVKDMPKLVQRYIQIYTQTVSDRGKAKYICVHSQDLLTKK